VVRPPPLCQSLYQHDDGDDRFCHHTDDMHGARAGSLPGHCLTPGCRCPAWNPPTIPIRVPRTSNPRHDRNLYLAWIQALDVAVHGSDSAAGYEVMMAEIERWQRRVLGLPAVPAE